MVQSLQTSRTITNFANTSNPKPDDLIVYIFGAWDVVRIEHLEMLKKAKTSEKNVFLYVGVWDDEMIKFYKGEKPKLSLQERVQILLACKWVDDVVIGAPYEVTNDLNKSLGIQKILDNEVEKQ